MKRTPILTTLFSTLCIATLAACSGTAGQDNNSSTGSDTGSNTGSDSSNIQAASLSAQQCAADNPYRADATSSTTTGSLDTEKTWIRAYFNEAYLWYDKVPPVTASAAAYSGSITELDNFDVPLPLSNYFEALKTKATTSSGALVDKFSFTYPTKAWNDRSIGGLTAGYGIHWATANNTAPRSTRIGIVDSGSPAALAGLQRGDTLIAIDGIDFINTTDDNEIERINDALFPTGTESHTFTFMRASTGEFEASLTSRSDVVIDPVPVANVLDYNGHKVGYLHFTDHIASAEGKLIAAIQDFQSQGVTDLVLDMRYNGGGYLYIASELAYMIAGPDRTNGKYFERTVHNDKRSSENSEMTFFNTSCYLNATYSCDNTQPLPTLNLGRVYVIAQIDTCSASESIINSLRGIDVEVVLIGETTCGKPYGFTAQDNCGISYFPIEFKGENYKGFGDYPDGFTPVTSGANDTQLTGCLQSDDADNALGSQTERMLATALQRIDQGTCAPYVTSRSKPSALSMVRARTATSTVQMRPPITQGRFLLPNHKPR